MSRCRNLGRVQRTTRPSSGWWLLFSPAMAFALGFTTIGYYTFATYISLAGDVGSGYAIAYRGFTVLVLLMMFSGRRYIRRKLTRKLVPGILFLILYLIRMLENILLRGVVIEPGNAKALLSYLFGAILSSLILASVWRAYDPRDLQRILSFLAIVFSIGALIAINGISAADENFRLSLEKVNPISLAYVGSSFMLFYLVVAQKSKKIAIEAIVVVPILLFIALKAQSRGMMLSTAAVVVIYFLILRGTRKIVFTLIGGLLALAAIIVANPQVIDRALGSISKIGSESDLSTAMRAISFQGAYEQFLADPIFGRWVIELTTNYYPHNLYLESLMAVGIVGSLPLIVHLCFASFASLSILRLRQGSWVWTFFALLFFREAIGSGASGSIWGNVNLWITSFIVIAIWDGHKREGLRAYDSTNLDSKDSC